MNPMRGFRTTYPGLALKLVQVLALAWLFVPPLAAEELVRQFSGERSGTTAEFEVRAPWILDWRASADLARITAMDVSLFNAGTGVHEGVVLRTKVPGNGVRMFDQSGRFYFRVDSTLMNWSLKVIQLTEEEAKAYTPKSNHPLDR